VLQFNPFTAAVVQTTYKNSEHYILLIVNVTSQW